MNEFVVLDFILSPGGMVAVVIILTQLSKGLFDKLVQNQTKWLVFGFSVLFGVFGALNMGDFSSPLAIFGTVLVWLANIAFIWQAAMKTFETVTGTGSPAIVHVPRDADSQLYKDALTAATSLLQDHKDVRVKISKDNFLSRE